MSNTPLIPTGRSIKKYNRNGNLIEDRLSSKKKEVLNYWEKYSYNEEGQKIKMVWGRKEVTNGYIDYKYKVIRVLI